MFDLKSNLARELKEAIKSVAPAPLWRQLKKASGRERTRVISTETQLREELDRVAAAFQLSDDTGRRAVDQISFAVPTDLPSDPRSEEYRRAQLALYRKISGRDHYTVANERSEVDLVSAQRVPFPYSTRSPATVGDQLIAQGFLLKTLGVAPPARLLELGPGWGNTTLTFLQMGYEVTAVEVDPAFAALVTARCSAFSDQLTVVNTDMLSFRSTQKFDVAVFFESFHHCADHLALLRQLDQQLAPDGTLVFASEPVVNDFPYPWGVSLDGLSLWSMRKYGWLELGFQTSYFFETLESLGWAARRYRSSAISTLTDVITARRKR